MNSMTAANDDLIICIDFLDSIGIETRFAIVDDSGFLPGLTIKNAAIIIHSEILKYPGDILHEAGHIAVVLAAERSSLTAQYGTYFLTRT
jgi:hypothetical protein